jgi:hypothetical protein
MAGMTPLFLIAAAQGDDGTTLALPFAEPAVAFAEAGRSGSVRQTRQSTTRGGVTATRVTRTDGVRRASKTVVTNGAGTWTNVRGHSAERGMGKTLTTHAGPNGAGTLGRSAHTPARVAGAPVVAHGGTQRTAAVVHTPPRTSPVVVHAPVRTAPVVVHTPPRPVVVASPPTRTVVVHRAPPPVVVHGSHARTVVVAEPAPPPPPVVRQPRPDPGLDRAGSLALGLGMGSLLGGYAEGGGYGDLGFGASGRYRPAAGLGLQLDLAHHREAFHNLSERDQTQVAGSVALFAFPESRVQPYALGGLTWTGRDIHDVVAFNDGTVAEVHTGASTFGPHGGLGLEIAFGPSVALDLEGRLIGSLNHLPDDPTLPAQGVGKVALQIHF